MKPYAVPAAPFVEILRERLTQIERAGVEAAPREALVEESGIHARLIYILLSGKQQNIAFDNADRIVTRLVGPMEWHTDPVLSEIYESVDMAAVDRRYPIVAVAA